MSRTLPFHIRRSFQRSIHPSSRALRHDVGSSKAGYIGQPFSSVTRTEPANDGTVIVSEPNAAPKVPKAGNVVRRFEPPSLVTFTYRVQQGLRIRQVMVSARTPPDELTAALPNLLFKSNPGKRPGLSPYHEWTLSTEGDVLYRVLSLKTEDELHQIMRKINVHVGEFKHHPHTCFRPPHKFTGNAWAVMYALSTHRPRGLSMKDVELAQYIDEIVAPFDVQFCEPKYHRSIKEAFFRGTRLNMLAECESQVYANLSNPPAVPALVQINKVFAPARPLINKLPVPALRQIHRVLDPTRLRIRKHLVPIQPQVNRIPAAAPLRIKKRLAPARPLINRVTAPARLRINKTFVPIIRNVEPKE